jgi:hypothetical protein
MIFIFFIITPFTRGLCMQNFSITLSQEERSFLLELTSKGLHQSQKVLNALILLACDEGVHHRKCSTNEEIARVLNTSMVKVDSVKKWFVVGGLDAALHAEKGIVGYAQKAIGESGAHPNALNRGRQPKGFAPWNLKSLADKIVSIDYMDNISHETGYRVLKKTNLNLGREKRG